MDDRARQRLRETIMSRLAALDDEDSLGRLGQSVVQLDQQSVGRLSRQDALLNQSMAKATQARRDTLRQALVATLQRLATADFGYCDSCGEDIAVKRLELDPTARLCIACASG